MKKFLVGLLLLCFCPSTYAAWTYKFLTSTTRVTAPGTNDGNDNLGFNIATGSWTASTKTLVKTAAFGSYTPQAGDYIYINSVSTCAVQNGLYAVASKTDADTLVLGALIAGAGVTSDCSGHINSSTGPWSMARATDTTNGAQGNYMVNVQGTYGTALSPLAADITIAAGVGTAPSTTAPVWWRAFATTIGDLDGQASSHTSMPTVYMDANHKVSVTASYQIFTNIGFHQVTGSGTATDCVRETGSFNLFDRCQFTTAYASANAFPYRHVTGNDSVVSNSYVTASTTVTAALYSQLSYDFFIGNYIVGGAAGIECAAVCTAEDNIITGATYGIYAINVSHIYASRNTIYNCGTGVYLSAADSNQNVFYGNVITDSSTDYGMSASAGSSTKIRNLSNVFYNNRTSDLNNLTQMADNTTDLAKALFNLVETASPYVTAGTNFQLQYNAKAMASQVPTTFENLSTTPRRLTPGAGRPPNDGWKIYSELLLNHDPHGSPLVAFAVVPMLCLGVIRLIKR